MDAASTAANDDIYWALQAPEEMPKTILEKFKKYHERIDETHRTKMWQQACQLYFGKDGKGGFVTSHDVGFGGEQGETVETRSNHFRSLVRRMHTMITEQRPEFEVSTVNDSGEGMAQATLGKMLLDYYMDSGKMEKAARASCEKALVVAESFVHQWWNTDAGEEVMSVNGGKKRAGDIQTDSVGPWDVATDLDMPAGADYPWAIIRREHHRWDLAAKFPSLAYELIHDVQPTGINRGVWKDSNPRKKESDWLECFIFYHDKTPAVPRGRMMLVCGDFVLFDGPLPYDRIPVYRIAPSEEFDLNQGYSDSWDVMGLQAIYDSILGGMFTTHDAYSIPNMLVDKGSNLKVSVLAGGMKKVEWDSKGGVLSPPEPMKQPHIPDSHFKLRELVRQDMEINFGMNAVSRGEATPDAKSGTHAALIDSKAIQYASGLVYSYVELLRVLAYQAIRLLQIFATEDRSVAIAGPDNYAMFRSFSSKDLSQVRQVRVELGSASIRTFAQKEAIADKLIEGFEGQITLEQYLAFRVTGRLEPLYKHQKSEVMAIRQENERMSRGEPTKVLVLDHHMLHIREHSCLLHNPDIRFDDMKSKPILDHIQEHIRQLTILQMANPGLLIATGQLVPEMPLPPQQAPGGPGAAPGAPPGGPGTGGPAPAPEKSDGGEEKAPAAPRAAPPGVPDNSALPKMPINPGNGRPSSPSGGRA